MGGRDRISSHQQSPENLASKYKVGVTTGQEGAEGSGGRPRKGDGERRVRVQLPRACFPWLWHLRAITQEESVDV